jgi:transcriptional regulator with GAF, ATPase, and Fis domain
MSEPFNSLDRQRGRLLSLGGLLLTVMCMALVTISWSQEGEGFEIERRWPTLVGLAGLVVIFVLYAQHKHQQLAQVEGKLRDLAVREARLQARFSELAFLFDIGTQLQLRLDLQSMLELAAQRLVPCLDAHQCSIMLHNEQTGRLEVRAAAGVDAELVKDASMRSEGGIAGHVFTKGETLILSPTVMEQRFPDEIKHGRTIASGLCVPMRFRGTAIGVVCVSRTSGEPFGEIHARMLEAFADHCAATVVKTHHHHELLAQSRSAA